MLVSHLLLFAGLSMAVSVVAALRRSHVFLIMASFNMATSGAVLLLATLGSANRDPDAFLLGFLLVCLSTLINLIFCGVAILIFRTRGTLRLDDFRELRG